MIRRLALSAATWVLMAAPAVSAAAVLSLDQAVQAALEHQPLLAEASASIAGAQARRRQSEAQLGPRVSLEPSLNSATPSLPIPAPRHN